MSDSILNCEPLPVILKKQQKRRNNIRYNEERRVMSKRGRLYVYWQKIPGKSLLYVRDLWHTLVNMRWRWLMLTVALVNMLAYLLFAGLFLFDAWISGDFNKDKNSTHKMCVNGVTNFTSFFMLGIETITTTGYGYFHPTEFCHFVYIIMAFSTLVTIIIDGAFISVVYAKISRPTQRIAERVFSKKAVICLRNSKLCLIFRVNDPAGKHWIRTKIHLYLLQDKQSENNEILSNHVTELQLKPNGMLFWPQDIVHEIDSNSPLWNFSAKDLMVRPFELLAVVTGSSVLTGELSKSQTSYLGNEVLWGHWFAPCMDFSLVKLEYVVNRKNFNKTVMRHSPLCSAKHLGKVEWDVWNKHSSLDTIAT